MKKESDNAVYSSRYTEHGPSPRTVLTRKVPHVLGGNPKGRSNSSGKHPLRGYRNTLCPLIWVVLQWGAAARGASNLPTLLCQEPLPALATVVEVVFASTAVGRAKGSGVVVTYIAEFGSVRQCIA
jgi:hypothetical protein